MIKKSSKGSSLNNTKSKMITKPIKNYRSTLELLNMKKYFKEIFNHIRMVAFKQNRNLKHVISINSTKTGQVKKSINTYTQGKESPCLEQ